MPSEPADVLTHLLDRLGSEEGRQRLQAAGHVPEDSLAVLQHAVITDCGPKHGVPGPVLQQQVIPLDVDHSWHVLIPARQTGQVKTAFLNSDACHIMEKNGIIR